MTKEEHEVLELTRDARTVFVSQLVARLTEREIREFFEKVRLLCVVALCPGGGPTPHSTFLCV